MKKTKILSLVLCLAFLLSSISLSAAAITFDDVENDSTVSWAKDSITKMTDAGYIKGYEDGTFRPFRAITKIECLILMSRMLGLEDKQFAAAADAAEDAYKTTVSKYNTTYAKELSYLLYCGVLQESDLVDYASAANANTQLLRYQAAMLMAKLMGADAEAKAYTVSKATYADDSSIPANAKSYVEYVTANNIMNGMDANANGEPQFSPITSLTRAQMAALLARMMDKMNLTYVSGKVESISNTTITVDGKRSKISVSTIAYMNGKKADTDDISSGDSVVIVSVDGTAMMIQGEEAQESVEIYGVISRKAENADGQHVTIADYEDSSITETYTLRNDCKIKISGSNGNFSDLKSNDFVKIVLNGSKAAEISTEDKTLSVTGKLVSIEYDNQDHVYINVSDKDGENVQQYVVSIKGASVTRDNDDANFRDLSAGDSVTLRLSYGKVTRVTATSSAERFSGLLTEIIISNTPAVTITSNGTANTYKLRSDAKITVAGSTADIYALRPNITVSGMLDSSEVKTLTAASISVSENGEMTGTVTGKNTSYNVITIKDDDGNTQSIYYNSRTTFLTSSGQTSTVKSIENGATISVTGKESNGLFEAAIVIIK